MSLMNPRSNSTLMRLLPWLLEEVIFLTPAIPLMAFSSGSTSITATKGDTGNTTFNLGAINRNALALVDFNTAGTGTGAANITTTAADGALGAYATFGKTDWAGVTGGNVTALTTYATNDFTNAANNVNVTSNQSPAADFTVNTIRFNTAAPVTLTLSGTNNTTSGILVGSGVGANTVTLAGGGITAPGELVVHQHNTAGDLVVDAAFTGSAAVTKGGAGVMVLNGANTNAEFTVVGGTLRIGANERIADSAIVNVTTGATLDLAGNTETVDRLNGTGTPWSNRILTQTGAIVLRAACSSTART